MHASLVVMSSIRRIAHIHMQFHAVSYQDIPLSPAPLPSKDDVVAFLTRYPKAPKHSFDHIILGHGGQVHCEAQLMGLVDAKASGVTDIGQELSMKISVCWKTSFKVLRICLLKVRTIL